jgi:hypothetical protein
MMLTWCVTAALKESFKLFQIYSYADTSWDDDRNSRKSTYSSCIMPFHMHSLMSSEGISRCQLQHPILSVPEQVPVLARKHRYYLCLCARSSVQMEISYRSNVYFSPLRDTPSWSMTVSLRPQSTLPTTIAWPQRQATLLLHPSAPLATIFYTAGMST